MSQRDRFVKGMLSRVGGPYCAYPDFRDDCADCSTTIAQEYAKATGTTITGSSQAQAKLGVSAGSNWHDWEPGDILVYLDGEHTGVYVGDGFAVHAMNEQDGVTKSRVDSDYWRRNFVDARRLPWKDGAPDHPKDDGAGGGTMASVTPQSPFRTLGNTDRKSFTAALSRSVGGKPSPLAAEADAIYDVLAPLGLTRLGAAMAWVERSNETNPADLEYYGRNLHNAWAVKNSDGSWAKYPTYAAAAEEWADRILGPTYADLTTVAEFVGRYAPWSDGNNPDDYGRKVAAQVNALPRQIIITPTPHPEPTPDPAPTPAPQPGVTMVRFAGTSVDVPLDVPLRIVLLPKTQTNQRPGIPMAAQLYVQHETGNYRAGADADMHLKYLQNGAEGQQLSYHFTVDEKEAIQIVPLNEVTWHGGDGNGECNYHGISCEATVQDNNKAKAKIRRNAEKLAAAAMLATHITRIQQHGMCCRNVGSPAGCHLGCPESIQKDNYWPTFESNVRAIMAGGGVVNPPPQPVPSYPGLPAWLPGDYFEAAFPLADPKGAVTAALIAWIGETGRVPYFVEKIDAGAGRNVWRFDAVTLLSDKDKVWREGKAA